MKTLYYYYYLWSKLVNYGTNPNTMATLYLSASQALFILGIYAIFLEGLYCEKILRWQMYGTILLIISINLYYYHIKGKENKIINEKPKFFNSNKISIFITILFFIITTYLFIGSDNLAKLFFNKHCF